MWPRSTICMKPTLVRLGNRGWRSIVGPKRIDRRGFHIVDAQHCMGIAHRDRAEFDACHRHRANEYHRSLRAACIGSELGSKFGNAHVHRHQAVIAIRGRSTMPPDCPSRVRVPRSGCASVQQRRDTARTVAALLDLAAVGIEDAIEDPAVRSRAVLRASAPDRSRRRCAGPRERAAVRVRFESAACDQRAGASNTRKSLPSPCIFKNRCAWQSIDVAVMPCRQREVRGRCRQGPRATSPDHFPRGLRNTRA